MMVVNSLIKLSVHRIHAYSHLITKVIEISVQLLNLINHKL
ncbi:hypothetical protein SLEP1_g7259 [Rubroshorea leprosula]|uniref:Uncharacterized protein n=1 Tax=Rubroshorea leprosula TaxID=152421 RepID=A0AAV5I8R5_9ROSI|nr:hypothetical protein SLEP1_g7259 [Rubroshorea leprosula]